MLGRVLGRIKTEAHNGLQQEGIATTCSDGIDRIPTQNAIEFSTNPEYPVELFLHYKYRAGPPAICTGLAPAGASAGHISVSIGK